MLAVIPDRAAAFTVNMEIVPGFVDGNDLVIALIVAASNGGIEDNGICRFCACIEIDNLMM